MLAAAEPDFEPDVIGFPAKQLGEIAHWRSADIEAKPRQQMFDEAGLMRAQPMTLAPAEEGTLPSHGGIAGGWVVISAIAACRAHRQVG